MFNNLGNSSLLWVMRENALKLLELNTLERYMIFWQRSIIFPLVIILSCYGYIREKSYFWLILCVITVCLGIIFNSLTLEKSPTTFLLISLFSFFLLIKRNISIWHILLSVVIILIFPTVVYTYYYYDNSFLHQYVLTSLVNRIFIVPSESLYEYILIFPNIHDHLLGRATQLFSTFNQDGAFHLSNYVAKVAWGDKFTSGNINTIYLGNFWAEFAYIGVVISTFAIGYIVNWYYSILLRSSNYKKNILFLLSTSISIPILSFSFISSNFTTLFFTRGLIFFVLLFYIVIQRNKYTSTC